MNRTCLFESARYFPTSDEILYLGYFLLFHQRLQRWKWIVFQFQRSNLGNDLWVEQPKKLALALPGCTKGTPKPVLVQWVTHYLL